MPKCRLETNKKSFFPRTINLWNNLTEGVRSAESVETFRRHFIPTQKELQVLYYYGERWPAVHHARLRIGCSKLNSDLCYNLHVIDEPACTCGSPLENAEHFFLFCPIFQNLRITMINEIEGVMPITITNLLFGNSDYSIDDNQSLFSCTPVYC